MENKEFWHWFAGFIDAKDCFGIFISDTSKIDGLNRAPVYLRARIMLQGKKEVLEYIRRSLSANQKVYYYITPSTRKGRTINRKYYHLKIDDQPMIKKVLENVYPYIIDPEKKYQIELMGEFFKVYGYKRKRRTTLELIEALEIGKEMAQYTVRRNATFIKQANKWIQKLR